MIEIDVYGTMLAHLGANCVRQRLVLCIRYLLQIAAAVPDVRAGEMHAQSEKKNYLAVGLRAGGSRDLEALWPAGSSRTCQLIRT